MCSQCVAARMGDALSSAIAPLAAVLLLPSSNVVIVEMLDQLVHVVKIAGCASVPLADGDLLLAVVVVLRHARVVMG